MIQITDPKVLPIGGGDDTNDAGMVYVRDYRSITFMVATTGSANMTIKFAGSLQEDKPDLEAAQSQSNLWDHIEVVDLQDGSAIDGDTGIAFAGTDDVRMFEANVNGLIWFGAHLTARSAGSAEITWVGFALSA